MLEIALLGVILCTSCAIGVSLRQFEFQRGSSGTVPCPAMDGSYSKDEIEATYWYFVKKGSSKPRENIISYFNDNIRSSNPKKYTIRNSSLVISNVAQSDEGIYSYIYDPWFEAEIEGSVEVSEYVSSKAKVNECSEDQSLCKIKVLSHAANVQLTCSVEHAKPAVNISWLRWSSLLNTWEEISATLQYIPYFCTSSEKDCFSVSDTVNSFATTNASLGSISSTFKCVTNSSRIGNITVTVNKTSDDISNEVTDPTRYGNEETTSMTAIVNTSECTFNQRSLVIYFVLFLFGLFVGIMVMLLTYCWSIKRNKRQTKKSITAKQSELEVIGLSEVI